MRILFINAINYLSPLETSFPPLGLAYLASSLRFHLGKKNFTFKIIDRDIKKRLEEFKPDIVGISAVSPNFGLAEKYAKIAKEMKLPVIVGGVHITALPISLTGEMDVGVIGEGEETIIALARAFQKKGQFKKSALEKIPGLAFWDKNKLVLTKPRKLIKPLDKIKMPARDLLKIKKHSYLFTSRGCPYQCRFCFSSRFWSKVRFFSAQYAVKEIKELIGKYGVNQITLYDDLFIAHQPRLAKFAKLLKKEGLVGKIKFFCSCRVNLVNEDMVKLLKQIGVVSVGLGLESGCPRILEFLKGKNISLQDSERAISLLNKYKIAANGSFIIGSPTETREEILQTLDFIKKHKLTYFDVYVLVPLPGTPIWDYAKKRGLVSNKMDWDKLSFDFDTDYKRAIILSETLSRDELFELYKLFQRQKTINTLKTMWTNPFLSKHELPWQLLKIAVGKLRSRWQIVKRN